MSGARRRPANVEVNQEHLSNMLEMGFPEGRCRRALKFFNNDFEAAVQHVCSTTEIEDDQMFPPEPVQEAQPAQQRVEPPPVRVMTMPQAP